MNRILIMNNHVYSGGAEKVMLKITEYLVNRGDTVTVLSIENDKNIVHSLYPKEIKYMHFDYFCNRGYNKSLINRLVNAIYKRMVMLRIYIQGEIKKYDIVLAFKEGQCMKFMSRINAPYKLAWIHFDYQYMHWTSAVFKTIDEELDCMKRYNHIVCVSEAVKRSVIKIVGDTKNYICRWNPVDVNEIEQLSKNTIECLEGFPIESSVPVFVTVGSLVRNKGLMRLLECDVRLCKKYRFWLWIIGEGDERRNLEKYIQENKLTNVVLWGRQHNPYPFVKKADWYISPSMMESYGLAIQEALILKVPVLAAYYEAIEECVLEKEAILVENSVDGIYEGMARVLSNPMLREECQRNIHDRTQQDMFDTRIEKIIRLWK